MSGTFLNIFFHICNPTGGGLGEKKMKLRPVFQTNKKQTPRINHGNYKTIQLTYHNSTNNVMFMVIFVHSKSSIKNY